jgi:hypothetical protein
MSPAHPEPMVSLLAATVCVSYVLVGLDLRMAALGPRPPPAWLSEQRPLYSRTARCRLTPPVAGNEQRIGSITDRKSKRYFRTLVASVSQPSCPVPPASGHASPVAIAVPRARCSALPERSAARRSKTLAGAGQTSQGGGGPVRCMICRRWRVSRSAYACGPGVVLGAPASH